MPIVQSRRRFVTNIAFAGAAGIGALGATGVGRRGKSFAAEPPPEITTIRLAKLLPGTCIAPNTRREHCWSQRVSKWSAISDRRWQSSTNRSRVGR
jgi:hypothetical protein